MVVTSKVAIMPITVPSNPRRGAPGEHRSGKIVLHAGDQAEHDFVQNVFVKVTFELT